VNLGETEEHEPDYDTHADKGQNKSDAHPFLDGETHGTFFSSRNCRLQNAETKSVF
jgi:hypothetical protein